MTQSGLLVHQGLDGWLFLTGGSNFVTTLYQRDSGHLPDAKLRCWRDAIVNRHFGCRMLDIRYAHLVVPEKLTVYGHKQAQPLVDPDLAPVLRLAGMFDDAGAVGWINLVDWMRAFRDDVDLYFRTDTHWTPLGCLLAYDVLCDSLALRRNDDLAARPYRDIPKLLDLGSKLTPRKWEVTREYEWLQDARRTYENVVVRLLETPAFGGEIHVGSHAKFRNPNAANDCKLLLFGDSFSGPGRHLLTALLAETVRELEFVWSANIDWRHVKRAKPDIVVTQMAERYMALAPNDRFNLRWTEFRQAVRGHRRRLDAWRRDKRQGSSKAP